MTILGAAKIGAIVGAKVGLTVGAIAIVVVVEAYQLTREFGRKRRQRRENVQLCVNDHDAPGSFG